MIVCLWVQGGKGCKEAGENWNYHIFVCLWEQGGKGCEEAGENRNYHPSMINDCLSVGAGREGLGGSGESELPSINDQ